MSVNKIDISCCIANNTKAKYNATCNEHRKTDGLSASARNKKPRCGIKYQSVNPAAIFTNTYIARVSGKSAMKSIRLTWTIKLHSRL